MSMKHSAITLKSPCAVRIYLIKCQCVPKYKFTQKLVNAPTRLRGMPAHPSFTARSDQSGRPAANILR